MASDKNLTELIDWHFNQKRHGTIISEKNQHVQRKQKAQLK